TALWDRRINQLGGILGVFIGLFMASIALEENIARFIGNLDPGLSIRLIAVLFSLFLLILTISAWGKTGLQKRYGLTWTAVSLIVLLTALFPNLLRSFPSLLGIHYGLAVAGLFILFLLLLVFHFSITISELHTGQQVLLQRIKQLESGDAPPEASTQLLQNSSWQEQLKWQNLLARLIRRPARGTTWGAPLIICIAVCAVFLVGMSAPQVMVGDEVTHYYMLETQAKVLPLPNFKAEIPTGWGRTEVRTYPHSFGWHYLGALLYRFSGGSFAAIQLFQALFLAQFLAVAYLLARSRQGVQTRAALPYLLILASIPMSLIFSVSFYQDIPMAAQVLTAFYLLRKNRWLLATLFMGFALGIKVTAILFFPAFFLCLFLWTIQRTNLAKTGAIACCSLVLIALCTWGLGHSIHTYTGATFYPLEKINTIIHVLQKKIRPKEKKQGVKSIKKRGKANNSPSKNSIKKRSTKQAKSISEQQASIIANHPGDL
ncbi:MAG: DUF2304 family protein, partial [Candidatus Electrothrix sp. AR3]|nr:DUF2304 family protein [Candidatus Electrothrix sp. AR3]